MNVSPVKNPTKTIHVRSQSWQSDIQKLKRKQKRCETAMESSLANDRLRLALIDMKHIFQFLKTMGI